MTRIRFTDWIAPRGRFGTAGNHTEFEADGTLRSLGNSTAWLDSMVPPTVFRIGGTALALAELTSGIYAHRFDVTDVIHFNIQFNHNMMVDTTIYPHIHLVNKEAITGAANVTFTLAYTWANIGTNFPAVESDPDRIVDMADAGALSHTVGSFAGIAPTLVQGGISSVLVGSLTRVDAGYTTANIFLLGFDIHYQVDTLGSREEFVK